MTAADRDQSTDDFRHNPTVLRQIAALSAILLALTLVAVIAGPGFGGGVRDWLWAALALGGLASLTFGALWLLRQPPVMLRVGPDGLHMPLGWRTPLAWRDIHRIRHLGSTRSLTGHRVWLAVDPAPGVLPDFRLPGPKRLERWHARRLGIRLPLHALDAAPETVIASIERFRPVRRDNDSI